MDFLTRRFGPFPVWAYAAAVVGAFVIIRGHNLLGAQSAPQPAQPNVIYGGELSPEQQPGYPGQFSLGPESLLPVTAISQTNGPAGQGTTANAPAAPVLINGTGLPGLSGVPPGGKIPH